MRRSQSHIHGLKEGLLKPEVEGEDPWHVDGGRRNRLTTVGIVRGRDMHLDVDSVSHHSSTYISL